VPFSELDKVLTRTDSVLIFAEVRLRSLKEGPSSFRSLKDAVDMRPANKNGLAWEV